MDIYYIYWIVPDTASAQLQFKPIPCYKVTENQNNMFQIYVVLMPADRSRAFNMQRTELNMHEAESAICSFFL